MEAAKTAHTGRRQLGDILVAYGILAPEDVETVLRRQRETGERFGEAVVALGLAKTHDLLWALSEQFGIQATVLAPAMVDRRAVREIGADRLRRLFALPVSMDEEAVVIATDDPLSEAGFREIAEATGRTVRLMLTSSVALRDATAEVLGGAAAPAPVSVEGARESWGPEDLGAFAEKSREELALYLHHVATHLQGRALHLEPAPDGALRVRLRTRYDGVLGPAAKRTVPGHALRQIEAHFDASETGAPWTAPAGDRVRVEWTRYPTTDGDAAVLRFARVTDAGGTIREWREVRADGTGAPWEPPAAWLARGGAVVVHGADPEVSVAAAARIASPAGERKLVWIDRVPERAPSGAQAVDARLDGWERALGADADAIALVTPPDAEALAAASDAVIAGAALVLVVPFASSVDARAHLARTAPYLAPRVTALVGTTCSADGATGAVAVSERAADDAAQAERLAAWRAARG